MTTTDTSTLHERLEALRDELQAVYELGGSKEMFACASATAREHGIYDISHFVYIVYSIAAEALDDSAAASAVAQYAIAAARYDKAPEGIGLGQRHAYIAAVTLLEFQDVERFGAFPDGLADLPDRLTFPGGSAASKGTLGCDACGHPWAAHTQGGMCAGDETGRECHCVMIQPPETGGGQR